MIDDIPRPFFAALPSHLVQEMEPVMTNGRADHSSIGTQARCPCHVIGWCAGAAGVAASELCDTIANDGAHNTWIAEAGEGGRGGAAKMLEVVSLVATTAVVKPLMTQLLRVASSRLPLACESAAETVWHGVVSGQRGQTVETISNRSTHQHHHLCCSLLPERLLSVPLMQTYL